MSDFLQVVVSPRGDAVTVAFDPADPRAPAGGSVGLKAGGWIYFI